MKFRHEWKHYINLQDVYILRSRLDALMKKDSHGTDGTYIISSLYFDDLKDTALKEKIDGVNYREKFRIRYYDYDASFIRLEKKSKINGLCNKVSCPITKEETQKIIDGDLEWMKTSKHQLMHELYIKMKNNGLKPKTIVTYTRSAYTYPAGNVRITLDYNIKTGLHSTDFLNPETPLVPVKESPYILEVKWDEYLPDFVRDIVTLQGRRVTAFSKYAACRMYD